MNIKLSNQGFILILLPLAVQVVFVAGFFAMLQQAEMEIAKERHRREIINGVNHITSLIMATFAENALHLWSAGRSYYARDLIPVEFARVREMAADEPDQKAVINELEAAWQAAHVSVQDVKRLANEGKPAEAMARWESIKSQFAKISELSEASAARFKELEDAAPKRSAEMRERQKQALILFLVLDAAMAVFLCVYFNNRTTARLKLLMANARSLALERPIYAQIPGNDEITELQKTFVTVAHTLAEVRERERAIVENAGDVICSVDENLVFTQVSPAAERLWGHSQEELLGKRLAQLIDPSDWDETRKQLAEIKTASKQKDVENRVKNAAGTSVDMLWNVNWSQEKQSYFCVVHDVSERRKLEKLKADFIAMISHDIRSPLNAVASFLTILETEMYGALNEKGKGMRATIEKSIHLVVRLVSDLLDLEKADSGMLNLSLEPVGTFKLMQQSTDVVKALAEEKNITISCGGEDLLLSLDEDRMVQVLVNLLANAIKFTPVGEKICLSCERNGDSVEISIADQGPGIKSENLASIFDRYYQVSAKDATVRGGTGLGLAIAKVIVEKHKGHIRAESDGLKGSRFVVDLPKTLEDGAERLPQPD